MGYQSYFIAAIARIELRIGKATGWEITVTNLVKLATDSSAVQSATTGAGVELIAVIVAGIEAVATCKRSHLGQRIKFSVKTLKPKDLCLRC